MTSTNTLGGSVSSHKPSTWVMLATKPLDKLSHRQGQGEEDLKEGIDTMDVVLHRYKNDQIS